MYGFEYRAYRLPFSRPIRSAHGLWTEREGIVIRLTDAEGRSACGEAAPISWFGTESMDEARQACLRFGKRVSDEQIDALTARYPCCQFALHAARAVLRDRLPPLRAERLPIAALLPAGTGAVEALERRAEEGYRHFKWKVGLDSFEVEFALLERLAERLPSGGRLRLDANGAWTLPQARRWLEACPEGPVEYIEQPLPRGQERPMLELARDHALALALDESVATLDSLKRWLDFGWPGIFVIKPSLAGPPDALLAEISRPEVQVVFSSALESRTGAAAALRVAFAGSRGDRALGFGAGSFFQDPSWTISPPSPSIAGNELPPPGTEEAWNRLPT